MNTSVSMPSPSTPSLPKTVVPTVSNVTTTVSSSTTVTSTAMSSFIPGLSRPRGRPPGSKNTNPKSNDTKKHSAPQMPSPSLSTLISSLLKPLEPSSFSGSLPNLNLITEHLEPSIRSTVLMLLAQPSFMTTLAQFPDPASMNTFLSEYFRLSNLPNIPQLMAGFTGVLNCLAASFQPPTSIQSTQPKPPKTEPSSLLSKSSAMSIFPTSNKPISSTPPSKPSISSATITPVTSPSINQSPSLLKPVASTVISVGSGQLTITPSISITPNITSTSIHAPLMQMPNFQQNPQKPIQMKVKQKPGPKPGSKQTSKSGLKPGPKPKNRVPSYPDLSIDLPKSLSIIPSSSTFVPPSQIPTSMGAEMLTQKPPKQIKPRKKSLEGNSKPNKTNIPAPKMPTMNKATINQQIESQMLLKQYQAALLGANPNNPNFMSQFEQFLTGMPAEVLKKPKATTAATTSSLIPQPKTGIKVKQLDQLQNISKPVQKPNKPPFTPPPTGMPKTMTSNAAVLNSFGTTISSLPHATQSIPHPYSSMLATSTSLPSNIQIRFVPVVLVYFWKKI